MTAASAKVFQRLTDESIDDFAERVVAAIAEDAANSEEIPFEETEEY